jgi:hypothetical protein
MGVIIWDGMQLVGLAGLTVFLLFAAGYSQYVNHKNKKRKL